MAWWRGPEVWLPWCLLATALVAVPVLGDDYLAYQLGLYLLYGLVAQGIALTWGRCGFLPLGQALFFGLGAYVSGGVLKAAQAQPAWWWAWPLAVLAPALLAWALARLLFARRFESGPYFSLITLALAMLGFQIASQWSSITGGFNGLGGIPDLPSLDRYSTLYGLIAAVVLVCTAAWVALDRLPLGTLWRATAEQENRLQFFGFATDRLKATAFGLSGALAGLAGALYAPHQGLVTPPVVGFQLSAELLIWAAVGGRGSPYGALLGAVGIGWLSATLRQSFVYWEVIVALLFIAVVLRFPGGAVALAAPLWRRLARRNRTLAAVGAPPRPGAAEHEELVFEGVRVVQHGVTILDGLDLRVGTRGVHGLIGPNGAGKTSAFNALTARLPLAAGHIRWCGEDLAGLTADAIARRGVGRKFQIPSVFPNLTVAEHLRLAMWAQRATAPDLLRSRTHNWQTPLRAALEAQLPFLVEAADRPAGALSQGQRQMLELVLTLLPEPRLLLLDEPCAGLSTQETALQLALIDMAVRRLHNTALLIEHDLSAVERLAAQVHVLHQGRRLASGTLAQIQAEPAVQAVYAGGRK
jgi:branched-chain amino acid transport system permease protein